jgi:predicted DNA-binding transcriptional regulator AlpA
MKIIILREVSQKTGYNQTYLWQLVNARKVKAERS